MDKTNFKGNREKSIVLKKAFEFGVKTIHICEKLDADKHYILSRQLIRSGTSIGANLNEALGGYSKKEFIYKMMLSLKEAQETEYWLKLIQAAKISSQLNYDQLIDDAIEIQRILTTTIKTARVNQPQN
jgi:four helix bundle protein